MEYLQCTDGKRERKTPNIPDCESNFTLTTPYTVQKTPSGNLKASTNVLNDFYYMNGTKVMSELLGTIVTSDYEPNDAVSGAMNDFIKKYSKLAVNVSKGEKKLPWKNIYFIEKDLHLWWEQSDIPLNKPVTIVQISWNTIISWNVDQNIMLLTKGTITFADVNSCNPTKPQNRQVVKWIFYAEKLLKRSWVLKNKDLNAERRCTEWWLTIKWVVIWRWLNQMMENSRSNLNDRFNKKNNIDGGKSVVMNWASVLIEYSPSIFATSTMPPGAEEFATALSIYKQ